MFIFAELDDYDFIFQDDETNSTGRIAAFDPFRTPSVALPNGRLPTFWVAGLEAGGQPLLSPPNMPHMVLTTENCVMVEERRVSVLFLDEICYFMSRAARWHTMPILYHFLRHDLCDPTTVEQVVSRLIQVLQDPNTVPCIAACANQSLIAISEFVWHPQFADMGLDRSLLVLKRATMQSLKQVMSESSSQLTLRRHRHQRVNYLLENMRREVTDVGGEKPFASVIHDEGRAVWGPTRSALQEALDDHLVLQLALDTDNLNEVLAGLKGVKGPLAGAADVPGVLDAIFGSDSDSD